MRSRFCWLAACPTSPGELAPSVGRASRSRRGLRSMLCCRCAAIVRAGCGLCAALPSAERSRCQSLGRPAAGGDAGCAGRMRASSSVRSFSSSSFSCLQRTHASGAC